MTNFYKWRLHFVCETSAFPTAVILIEMFDGVDFTIDISKMDNDSLVECLNDINTNSSDYVLMRYLDYLCHTNIDCIDLKNCSTLIRRIAWNNRLNLLGIEFHNNRGEFYVYKVDNSEQRAIEAYNAPSVGKYYLRNIKGKYERDEEYIFEIPYDE